MSLPFNQVVVQPPPQLAKVAQKNVGENFEDLESQEFSTVLDEFTDDSDVGFVLDVEPQILEEEVLSLLGASTIFQVHGNDQQNPNVELLSFQFGSELIVAESPPAENRFGPVIAETTTVGIHSESSTQVSTDFSSQLDRPGSVAQQTVRALQTEFTSFYRVPSQSVTIEINPPELGRIHIQVEMASDQLSAQIIATEIVSAELLSRQKDLLMDSLMEFGFGETTVDISHGSLDGESDWEDGNEGESTDTRMPIQFEDDSDGYQSPVVVVGLNLVA